MSNKTTISKISLAALFTIDHNDLSNDENYYDQLSVMLNIPREEIARKVYKELFLPAIQAKKRLEQKIESERIYAPVINDPWETTEIFIDDYGERRIIYHEMGQN